MTDKPKSKIVVAVGTESALKIRAVEVAFEGLGYQQITILSCKAESGVAAQPIGKNVMMLGAQKRADGASEKQPKATFYIGMENGIIRTGADYFDVTCVYILTSAGETSQTFSTYFPIPRWMGEIVMKDETELGEIVQKLSGGGEKDPMKYLSEGTVLREEVIMQAIKCALAPLLHANRYEKPT